MTFWGFADKEAFNILLAIALIAWLINEVVKTTLKAQTRRLWLKNVELHG